MPAEFMSRSIAMPANALSELFDFFDELLARHLVEVRVHDAPFMHVLPAPEPLPTASHGAIGVGETYSLDSKRSLRGDRLGHL